LTANYCTHFSDPKNINVSAFMANVLAKLRLDTLAIQHSENGKVQAAAHYDFESGGNGNHNSVINGGKGIHGGKHANDRHGGKGRKDGGSAPKSCAECHKKSTPRVHHYTRCVPCEQAHKANALIGSSAGGKSLLAKQHDKRKKPFAKGKKARAHSVHVRVNFDDDSTMSRLSSGSADDNDSFSSASAASSDASSSHGVKMSKKTRQKARACANAALSNRGRAHSNFAAVVSSSRSRASAAALPSASVQGS